jgi:hypothetical protein
MFDDCIGSWEELLLFLLHSSIFVIGERIIMIEFIIIERGINEMLLIRFIGWHTPIIVIPMFDELSVKIDFFTYKYT